MLRKDGGLNGKPDARYGSQRHSSYEIRDIIKIVLLLPFPYTV